MSATPQIDPRLVPIHDNSSEHPTQNRRSTRIVAWRHLLLLLLIPLLATSTYLFFIKFIRKPAETLPLRAYTEVTSMVISADGKRLAVSGFTNEDQNQIPGPAKKGPLYSSIRVWDLDDGVPKSPREYRPRDGEFDTDRTLIALSPDGSTLAALGTIGWTGARPKDVIVFWSVESKEIISQAEVTLHDLPAPGKVYSGPSAFSFTKDGKSAVFATELGMFQVNVKDANGTQTRLLDAPGNRAVFVQADDCFVEVRLNRNKKTDWLHEVARWKLSSETEPNAVRLGRFVSPYTHSSVSPDGKSLGIFRAMDGTSQLATFETSGGKQLPMVVSNKERRFLNFPAMAFSGDGKLLGVVWELMDKQSYSVALYQTTDGKRLHENVHDFDPKVSGILRARSLVAFTPDGFALLYVRQPNALVRMDVKTGEEKEYSLR